VAFKLATLFVDIVSNNAEFTRSLAGTSMILGGLVSTVQRAAEAGSNLFETMNKVSVTFGNSQVAVQAMANEMATQFGAVKTTTLDAASNFGLIGQAAGMSEAASAALAIQMTRLADDASSFFNVPLDVALEKIRSGLVGQSRPLREFGVLLSKSAVDHELLAMGVRKTHGEFTEQEKVMGRVAIITRGLAKAQGDHERTMGSYVNQMRKMKGEAENYMAVIGAGVAGAEAQFLSNLSSKGIMGAVERLAREGNWARKGDRDSVFQQSADVAAGVQRGGGFNPVTDAQGNVGTERTARLAAGTEDAARKAIEAANKAIAESNKADAEAAAAAADPTRAANMFQVRSLMEEFKDELEAIDDMEYAAKNRRSMQEVRFLADYFMYDTKSDKQYHEEAKQRKAAAKEENEFMREFLGLDMSREQFNKFEHKPLESVGVADFAAKMRLEQGAKDVPQKQLTELQALRKQEAESAKMLADAFSRGNLAVLG
jgi:F0F1-type ATP synthase epsilon subunit